MSISAILECMLPTFPQEVPLTLPLRESIEEYTRTFLPYSDFNFVSLYTYNTHEHIRVSLLHNNLVIRFRDYTDKNPETFYSFLGNTLPIETAEILLRQQKDEGLASSLKLIPAHNFMDMHLPESLSFIEDRDQFDYILSTKDITDTSKSAFSHKRRMIRRFEREHPDAQFLHTIDIANPGIQTKIIQCITTWGKIRNMKDEDISHEKIALERLLDQGEHLAVEMIGIEQGDELLAFSIFNKVSDSYGVIHFGKFNPSYRGIFETLVMRTLTKLHEKGCTYANVEQDLGIEGMRQAKMLWYPDHFLKKYTIQFIEK